MPAAGRLAFSEKFYCGFVQRSKTRCVRFGSTPDIRAATEILRANSILLRFQGKGMIRLSVIFCYGLWLFGELATLASTSSANECKMYVEGPFEVYNTISISSCL
jgi:hypothetical protein